jgi:TolB protein
MRISKLIFTSLLTASLSLRAQSLEEGPEPAQVAPATPSASAPATTTAPSNTSAATATQPAPGSPRIYIPVGQPNLKKILLALEATVGPEKEAREFFQTLFNDMDFTDLFAMLPEKELQKSGGIALGTFNFNAYRAQGVEFLIKSALRVNSKKNLEAEVRLYDVARGTQILGRIYPFVSASANPARELAHFTGNDIIKTLTGEEGIFRTRLIMSCGSKRKEIFIMDFDGENIKQLTNDGNFALSPTWAPDGRRIAFTSYRPPVKGAMLNPNLYIYDLAKNARSVLTAAKGINSGADFHPREEKIAYTFSQNGKPEIYILDLGSKVRKPFTRTQFFSVEPDWSPDGLKLAYSSSLTGRPHLYVANADGSGAAVQLTKVGVYNSSPKWNPRGDRLAFSGQENMANNFNIFLIDPNGSNLVRITDGTHSSENPVFSPDGRHIAFSSNREGKYRIYVMTAQGTNIRPLSPTRLGDCKQPSWSPRL